MALWVKYKHQELSSDLQQPYKKHAGEVEIGGILGFSGQLAKLVSLKFSEGPSAG